MICRIANAAGFLGDNLDAPRRLVEAAEVDYLTLEYLAELTMSILAWQRRKDPQAGYAADFLTVLSSLLPALRSQPGLRVVTNAGGVNPASCARRAGEMLAEAGLGDAAIGVVTGDDLAGYWEELRRAGVALTHLDTGAAWQPSERLVSANVYLGAAPIVEALQGGARIVLTGRVADAALTLGPAVHHFGWAWDDFDRLAGASVAGHLIECGAQVTGGFSTHWQLTPLENVGYPIAEVADDGTCTITKPEGTGGRVDRRTVCEQLVYEIGDPAQYLTPDVDVDFTRVEVEETGPERVSVRGARGGPPPEALKVSTAEHAGYQASGLMLVYGRDCRRKAAACAEIVLANVRAAGFELQSAHVEMLGGGDGVPGLAAAEDPRELMLRITAQDPRREAVERFARELSPLATAGPAGLAGYASGRAVVRPCFDYEPVACPRDAVFPQVEVRPAGEWATADGQ